MTSRQAEYEKYLWPDGPQPDAITRMAFQSWDELYARDWRELDAMQLAAARERFESLRPRVRALADHAEAVGVSRIDSPDDLVKLCFQHTHYKSYPLSLLEKGRFDLLTRWLDGLTTRDLSGIDASGCDSIDGWLALLEEKTDLVPLHTSGTTGKLSFFPRTRMESNLWMALMLKLFEGFHDEADFRLGFDGERMPYIYPSLRYGRAMSGRMVHCMTQFVAPTPADSYTLSDGMLSADVVSLSGRIRVAQAKGELDRMVLSDSQRAAFVRYMEEAERRPQETEAFLQRMAHTLKGQRVYINSQTSYMVQAALEGRKRGISGVFSPDSIGNVGGGGKGVVLPPDWKELIRDFTGIPVWRGSYAMTEMIGAVPLCPQGFFHVEPYHIPLLLDPVSGKLLPRSGTQTGRFALFDLLPDTYWGGFVSGDKVTMEWDAPCPCGRRGAYIHDTIERYSDAVTGDDKVNCSATVDNTDEALKALLSV